MDNKVIITVATTGAWPTKKNNPAIPLTPREIADDVYACWKAGAAVAHLHMRDDEGNGTMNKAKFAEAVSLIRERCDIVVNLTTSGDLHATEETRMAHLIELKPELASYDCGSMNWMHNSLFLNPPAFLEKLGMVMQENGVKPEVEIFDGGMIENAKYYMKKGVLKAPVHFQFVLGAAGGMAATVENLVFLKNQIPAGSLVRSRHRTRASAHHVRGPRAGRPCPRGHGRQRLLRSRTPRRLQRRIRGARRTGDPRNGQGSRHAGRRPRHSRTAALVFTPSRQT